MDTTDPDITFDEKGICNHCYKYDELQKIVASHGDAQEKLNKLVEKIKKDGKGKDYDCIIGVSGGVDSSYVAYLVRKLGLRPLAVHLDNGWDSELAVSNIQRVLELLKIDLYTYVIDWEEFRDLQLAFLKGSTPDSEIPSDHAINSLMFSMAKKIGIRYVITGENVRTESHLPKAWSQGHMDWRYIYSIHRQFGKIPLKTFPHMSFLAYNWYRVTLNKFTILNYINFVKQEARATLEQELGWRDYGGKHYESIYTRFYQGYILPKKFGYDKRRSHLSSLICSGEISRKDALEELKKEPYPLDLQQEDMSYVIKKLEISEDEFNRIMALPCRSYMDYPSYSLLERNRLYQYLRFVYRIVRKS